MELLRLLTKRIQMRQLKITKQVTNRETASLRQIFAGNWKSRFNYC